MGDVQVSEQEAGNVGVTIPLGSGYEAPKIWFKGENSDDVRREVVKAFGFPDDWANRSLDEVVVEASRWARGIYKVASELGGEPKITVWTVDGGKAETPTQLGEEAEVPTEAPRPRKKGLAAQAAEAEEPDVTSLIEGLIGRATSRSELEKIHAKYEYDGWDDRHTEQAKAKIAKLEAA